MPTYAYRCTQCGDEFDIKQSFTDDALTECGACGGKLRKLFSPVGVVFKGSGFYRTDSAPRKGSDDGARSGGTSGDSKGSSKGAGSGSSSSSTSGGSKQGGSSGGATTGSAGSSSTSGAATKAASSSR